MFVETTLLSGAMSSARTRPCSTTYWVSPANVTTRTPSTTRLPFGSTSVKSAAASASLEADLDTVFINDHCGEIFARFGVANGNGVAARAIFHRERFHSDDEQAIGGRDFHEFTFFDQRTAGNITPGEQAP